jgi:hypothetical protein
VPHAQTCVSSSPRYEKLASPLHRVTPKLAPPLPRAAPNFSFPFTASKLYPPITLPFHCLASKLSSSNHCAAPELVFPLGDIALKLVFPFHHVAPNLRPFFFAASRQNLHLFFFTASDPNFFIFLSATPRPKLPCLPLHRCHAQTFCLLFIASRSNLCFSLPHLAPLFASSLQLLVPEPSFPLRHIAPQ